MASFGVFETVLGSVRTRIIDQLDDSTEDNTILSDDPMSRPHTPGAIWFVVAPSPQEQVDLQAQNGGGQGQMSVRTRIIVAIGVASTEDAPDRIPLSYTQIQLLKRKIIKALTAVSSGTIWVPTGANEPLFYAEGNYVKTAEFSNYQLAFDVEYDEDYS